MLSKFNNFKNEIVWQTGGNAKNKYKLNIITYTNTNGLKLNPQKDKNYTDVMKTRALKDALDKNGTQTRVQSAITMTAVAEPYIRLRAIRHLEKGRVVIFAAGTGNPYFTTDTAASLRAAEIEASLMLKSTRVDGVFDKDPEKDTDAKKFDEISYKEVVSSKLKVMDLTAITLCEENKMPIRVFDGTTTGNIYKALTGESLGTLIK